MLKSALFWLNQGIAVIPIAYRSKFPDAKLLPIKYDENGQPIKKRNGKIQHDWEQYQSRLPTEQEVVTWFSEGDHNLAIVTGWGNLVVIDFDNFQAYNSWQLETTLPPTYSVLTTRGLHLYFHLENSTASLKLPGIDIQSYGKYVLVPPSIHPSGSSYIPLNASIPILSVECINDIINIPEKIRAIAQPRPGRNGNGHDLVSKVKKAYPILEFFPDAIQSGDRWYKTLCPFHDDHTESFWIDAARGLCGCFAGCTRQVLDVIDLWAVLNDMSIEEAISDMQDRVR